MRAEVRCALAGPSLSRGLISNSTWLETLFKSRIRQALGTAFSTMSALRSPNFRICAFNRGLVKKPDPFVHMKKPIDHRVKSDEISIVRKEPVFCRLRHLFKIARALVSFERAMRAGQAAKVGSSMRMVAKPVVPSSLPPTR